jgi:High potential iron-sulfur protein
MSKTIDNSQRRRVLFAAVAAAASAPFARNLLGAQTEAAALPHLSEDDPTAKALHYHSDATQAPRVDKPGAPAQSQFCHNCRFVQSDSGEWRPCQIFPGKAVNANGWCASWVARSG